MQTCLKILIHYYLNRVVNQKQKSIFLTYLANLSIQNRPYRFLKSSGSIEMLLNLYDDCTIYLCLLSHRKPYTSKFCKVNWPDLKISKSRLMLVLNQKKIVKSKSLFSTQIRVN